MFKKRNIDKKVDLNKDIETIEIRRQEKNEDGVAKNALSKKISKQNEKDSRNAGQKAEEPRKMRYGLIEKEAAEMVQRPKEQNPLMNIYVKKRMEEINAKKEQQAVDTTAIQILQWQKQYLTSAERKITEYDVKEIQKKLEKMAIEAIKGELENRNKYMIDLLQNEYERMEYASKKDLKMLKQERQRLEKELSSKYNSEGRRHYIEYLKHQNLNG